MKKIIVFIGVLTFWVMANEYDTLILQHGIDGYNGCVDVTAMNDFGTKMFGNQIKASHGTLPIANYVC